MYCSPVILSQGAMAASQNQVFSPIHPFFQHSGYCCLPYTSYPAIFFSLLGSHFLGCFLGLWQGASYHCILGLLSTETPDIWGTLGTKVPGVLVPVEIKVQQQDVLVSRTTWIVGSRGTVSAGMFGGWIICLTAQSVHYGKWQCKCLYCLHILRKWEGSSDFISV